MSGDLFRAESFTQALIHGCVEEHSRPTPSSNSRARPLPHTHPAPAPPRPASEGLPTGEQLSVRGPDDGRRSGVDYRKFFFESVSLG
jgi:hypothetical protein